MYQLEVKRFLVEHEFCPADGWQVTVHVDGMERAKGGSHSADKQVRVCCAEDWLRNAGVTIGTDPDFGAADLVASKQAAPTVVVEIEDDSSKQKEQALYSVLGQAVMLMKNDGKTRYGLAVPDTSEWERQLEKIPPHIRSQLSLTLWLVGEAGVRQLA